MPIPELQDALKAIGEARSLVQQCITKYAAEEKAEGGEEKAEGPTPPEKQPKDLKGAAQEARTRFRPGPPLKRSEDRQTVPEQQSENKFPDKHTKQ